MTPEEALRVAEDFNLTVQPGWGLDALEAARALAAELRRLHGLLDELGHGEYERHYMDEWLARARGEKR